MSRRSMKTQVNYDDVHGQNYMDAWPLFDVT
jgi:hypothetical protein